MTSSPSASPLVSSRSRQIDLQVTSRSVRACSYTYSFGTEGKKEVVVKNPRRDTVSREVLRHPEFENLVKLGRVRDHFLCEFFIAVSIFFFQPLLVRVNREYRTIPTGGPFPRVYQDPEGENPKSQVCLCAIAEPMADGGRSAGHRNGGVVIAAVAVDFICSDVPLSSNCPTVTSVSSSHHC